MFTYMFIKCSRLVNLVRKFHEKYSSLFILNDQFGHYKLSHARFFSLGCPIFMFFLSKAVPCSVYTYKHYLTNLGTEEWKMSDWELEVSNEV